MPRKKLPEPFELAPSVFFDSFTDQNGKPILRFWHGQFWRHDGRRCRTLSKIPLQKIVRGWLIKNYGKVAVRLANQIIDELKLLGGVYVPGHVTTPSLLPTNIPHLDETFKPVDAQHLISVKNGIFDADAWCKGDEPLTPHSPELFTLTTLPFDFQSDAQAPVFSDFLWRACAEDPEQYELALQWLGYLCTFDTTFRKVLIIMGETASGKSTFTETITLLLGADTVTAVGLDGIGTQFQEAAMIGKLANICQECRFVSATAVEKIKQLSSGDAVTQDVKHQKGLTYKPTARLVMASNQEPRFADSSEAIWDRLSVLHFPQSIPLEERDRDLLKKIEDELPGIFAMAMEALHRLHKSGQFVDSATSTRLTKTFQLHSNPERMFVKECFAEDSLGNVTRNETMDEYREFCRAWGYQGRASREKVFGEVRKRFPWVEESQTTVEGERERSFRGLRLERVESPQYF